MAVGASLAGLLSLTTVIVNWFDKHRAKALSLMATGMSLGGLAIPLVTVAMVTYGWRGVAFGSGVLVLLVGVLGDKDWRAMLRPLQHAADAVVLTSPPTAPAERCWNPHEVLAEVPSPNTHVVENFTGALEAAWRLAAGGTIVVTGSFHTVGDAMIALGHATWGADASLPPPSFAV